jgi:hypothetical protein
MIALRTVRIRELEKVNCCNRPNRSNMCRRTAEILEIILEIKFDSYLV